MMFYGFTGIQRVRLRPYRCVTETTSRDYLERFLQMEKELTEDAQKLYYKYFQ